MFLNDRLKKSPEIIEKRLWLSKFEYFNEKLANLKQNWKQYYRAESRVFLTDKVVNVSLIHILALYSTTRLLLSSGVIRFL